jgi:hypothetical protein
MPLDGRRSQAPRIRTRHESEAWFVRSRRQRHPFGWKSALNIWSIVRALFRDACHAKRVEEFMFQLEDCPREGQDDRLRTEKAARRGALTCEFQGRPCGSFAVRKLCSPSAGTLALLATGPQ